MRATPIALVDRAALAAWSPLLATGAGDGLPLSAAARAVRAGLASRGAVFFSDLVRMTGLLRTQAEQALGELVAWGLVTSDNFTGLRALITPASRRASFSRPLPGGGLSVDAAGRWSLVEHGPSPAPGSEAPAEVAWALLQRYGVVFRALLGREGGLLPPWRELARACRRLEARGEVRGGRFVSGFSGEQFALPEAVEALRVMRREERADDEVAVSAADPLNLCGIITPGPRVPAGPRNRVLFRGGVPVVACIAGELQWLVPQDPRQEWAARNALIRADRGRLWLPGGTRQN